MRMFCQKGTFCLKRGAGFAVAILLKNLPGRSKERIVSRWLLMELDRSCWIDLRVIITETDGGNSNPPDTLMAASVVSFIHLRVRLPPSCAHMKYVPLPSGGGTLVG